MRPLLLAALARLYGALLVLYPKAFRCRYEAEMRRDFFELLREGLKEGGAAELVRVLAQAHSDLVVTALKERNTTMARRYASYLSVDPRIVTRAAAGAIVAVVLVSVGVVAASLLQTPTYEASALVLVGGQQENQWTNSGGSGEEIQTLEWVELPTQTMIHTIDSRPVADKAIQRLGLQMKPTELLDNLTVEQLENTQRFIVLSYQDADPVEATRIANTVGEVSSELISERSTAGIQLTANVWEEAIVPESPVSPHPLSNGLLTLVVGWALTGLVVLIHRSS
jgi:capsular polysaccharide biosynthesis protein